MKNFFEKKAVKVVAAVLLCLLVIYTVFQSGTFIMSAVKKPWTPDVARQDISAIVNKSELTDAEYELVYRQTGLTRIGVDRLLWRGEGERILEIQDSFLGGAEPDYNVFGAFVGAFEHPDGHYAYAALEDGDIICCLSTYLSFFRIGHCGIVLSSSLNLIAESDGYDTDMKTVLADNFFNAASFVVLRVKTDDETRAAVTDYVWKNMIGTPYDFLTGIFEPKDRDPLRATHCSHAVWYAYNKFGIDLDSDGGKIVSPLQIARSPLVEIVQIRGIDPLIFE